MGKVSNFDGSFHGANNSSIQDYAMRSLVQAQSQPIIQRAGGSGWLRVLGGVLGGQAILSTLLLSLGFGPIGIIGGA